MIFASDLDQTLIYSKRHIETLLDDEKVVIEYKDGVPLSYMSRFSQSILKEISEKTTFIPVTTRIMEQYKRINLGVFKQTVPYAVLSNGGRILINGKDDKEWQTHIRKGLKDECLDLYEVLSYFKEHYSDSWIKSIRIAEDFFIYCIVDPERVPVEKMIDFRKWLNRHNWTLSIQGRKIYFIPRVLQKCKALDYLSSKLGQNLFAGAGDSFLDLSFLKKVDYPVVPRHGELFYNYLESLNRYSIKVTKETGIQASEELLIYILNSLG